MEKQTMHLIHQMEEIKKGANRGPDVAKDSKMMAFVLERNIWEIQKQSVIVQDQIRKETEDFLDYVELKQGSIQTLNEIQDYMDGRLAEMQKQLRILRT